MKVPIATWTAELEVRRSRFIGHAAYFDRPDTIKQLVNDTRERHAGCNHVVYAYAVGGSGDTQGMSDDHEPKGTAGRPVLEVVRGSGITNMILTVVRFFGGTKLGTGGLVRAYTESAQAALAGLETEELIERLSFEVRVPYAFYEPVVRLIRECSGTNGPAVFEESVVITGKLPVRNTEQLSVGLADLSGGSLSARFYDGSKES